MITVKGAMLSRAIVLHEIAEMFKDHDMRIYEHLEAMRRTVPVGEEEYAEAKQALADYLKSLAGTQR